MSTKNDGGAAFPETGMSLRDWFAGQALKGLLSNSHPSGPSFTTIDECTNYYAKLSFLYADAMLKAREVSP